MFLSRLFLFLALMLPALAAFDRPMTGRAVARAAHVHGIPAPEMVAPGKESGGKIRLLVLTDISSLTAGVREPDDGQSLIRLLLYANEFDIEGLIASSNMQHGETVRPELIQEAIEAYRLVRPNLLLHSRSYPPADRLLSCVKAGQPVAGPTKAVWDSIGPGKDTEASEWIIRAGDRSDSRPLWVVIWGGSADLAQALWKVRETRSREELKAFLARLRVHSIHDQDSTGPWIKREFPALWVLTQNNSMRGMYRGGDVSLSSSEWVEAHTRNRGPLGALYPNYRGGDIWGSVKGVKEGDTPSFLSLIPNGLSVPEAPELGGWGGRFRRVEGDAPRFIDDTDRYPGAEADRAPGMATVYRWREAYQAEFAARLDWCVRPRTKANHYPVVRVKGRPRRKAKPGEAIALDARGSSDPDGDTLHYSWSVYPESPGSGNIDDPSSPLTRYQIPAAAAGFSRLPIHLLLAVRDSGSPPLTRYERLTIEVD